MKRDNINYLLVGSFVVLMAALLLYALYRITGHSTKGDAYVTHFGNVAGIKVGSVVSFEGLEVGNVAAIELVEATAQAAGQAAPGRFRILLNLRLPLRLPVDSQALILTPGLLSAALVEIRQGRSPELLSAGGQLAGAPSANLMESVATLATDLSRIADTGLKPLLAQINRRVDSLGGSLDQHLPAALSDLRQALGRLNRTAANIEALFNPQNQQHWGGVLRNADLASANALALSQDLRGVRRELEGLLQDSRGVVGSSGKEVQHSLTELREALRRANVLLYQLESAGRNLNEFSRQIRANPAALLQNRPPVEAAGDTP